MFVFSPQRDKRENRQTFATFSNFIWKTVNF